MIGKKKKRGGGGGAGQRAGPVDPSEKEADRHKGVLPCGSASSFKSRRFSTVVRRVYSISN